MVSGASVMPMAQMQPEWWCQLWSVVQTSSWLDHSPWFFRHYFWFWHLYHSSSWSQYLTWHCFLIPCSVTGAVCLHAWLATSIQFSSGSQHVTFVMATSGWKSYPHVSLQQIHRPWFASRFITTGFLSCEERRKEQQLQKVFCDVVCLIYCELQIFYDKKNINQSFFLSWNSWKTLEYWNFQQKYLILYFILSYPGKLWRFWVRIFLNILLELKCVVKKYPHHFIDYSEML